MDKDCGDENGDVKASPSKRRALCKADVTVVVGGVEFKHYSQFLCHFSTFFDAALNCGMKEDKQKIVELPGDPKEWKEVAKFFDPSLFFSPNAATVTQDNIYILLPWFHYLEMANLMEECERSLRRLTFKDGDICRRFHTHIGGFRRDSEWLSLAQSELSQLCRCFDLCLQYGFEDLKQDIQTQIQQAIESSPDFFTFETVSALVSTMRVSSMDTDTKKSIWNSLKVYLPQHVVDSTSGDIDALLKNELLPSLIYDGMVLFVLTERDDAVLPSLLHRHRTIDVVGMLWQNPGMKHKWNT